MLVATTELQSNLTTWITTASGIQWFPNETVTTSWDFKTTDFTTSYGNITDPETPTVQQLAWRISMSIFTIIIMLSALIGNSLVMIAIYSTKSLRRTNNFLLISLAISDSCSSLTCMPLFITDLLYDRFWIEYDILCPFYSALHASFRTISITNLAAISLERVFIITKPLKYPRVVTTRRIIGLIILLWTVGLCYGFLQVLWSFTPEYREWKKLNPSECRFLPSLTFAIIDLVITFCTPLIIMSAAYSKIFCIVQSQLNKIRPHFPEETEAGFSEISRGNDHTPDIFMTHPAITNIGSSIQEEEVSNCSEAQSSSFEREDSDDSSSTSSSSSSSRSQSPLPLPTINVTSSSGSKLVNDTKDKDQVQEITSSSKVTTTCIEVTDIESEVEGEESQIDLERHKDLNEKTSLKRDTKVSSTSKRMHLESVTSAEINEIDGINDLKAVKERLCEILEHQSLGHDSDSVSDKSAASSKSSSDNGKDKDASTISKSTSSGGLSILNVRNPPLESDNLRLQSALKSRRGSTDSAYQKRGSVTFKLGTEDVTSMQRIAAKNLATVRTVLVDDDMTGSSDAVTSESWLTSGSSQLSSQRGSEIQTNNLLEPSPQQNNRLWNTEESSYYSPSVSRRSSIFGASSYSESMNGSDRPRYTRRRRSLAQRIIENKAIKMTAAVIGAFMFSWLPYEVTFLVRLTCTKCVSLTTMHVVTLLTFVNSALNPFIYNFYSQEFRRAIKKVCHCDSKIRTMY